MTTTSTDGTDDNIERQNEQGEWETAEPLPFLGAGIDWEVDETRRPITAVGYIGHRRVAEVTAGGRSMLGLKMILAGIPYRSVRQDSPS